MNTKWIVENSYENVKFCIYTSKLNAVSILCNSFICTKIKSMKFFILFASNGTFVEITTNSDWNLIFFSH